MRTSFTLLLICLCALCFGQAIPVSTGYALLNEATGDLHKDGIAEKVIVYDTPDSTGKVIYEKKTDHFADCLRKEEEEFQKHESEIFYKKGIRLNLDNRNLENIKLISPVHKYELYL